ncbi:septum formation inhibitor Maf [Gammaproteobacteria bacterium AH-315-M22]|nr:septum formation inhibitor Maf [Gammaproteobacteria bacterium AH-315-M22]
MNNITLILASSSPYRRELLSRLRLPFHCISPNCDETPLNHESATDLAARLALLKAKTIAKLHPDALIIGSDQTVESDGELFGKPLNHASAVAQLGKLAGKIVHFHTSLCLLNAISGQSQQSIETVEVTFKPLSQATIEAYLKAEQPYDCAGAFKSEGLGNILFESIQSQDPTALIGLPLIRLCQFLENEGIKLV